MHADQTRPRAVFLVLQASDEHLLRLGLWTVTAASVGEDVDILLCAPALARLADGSFDALAHGSAAKATILGLPPPTQLIDQARQLAGVRLLGCDTELRLAGLQPDALDGRLDAVVSLPSFWREARGARIVTL